MKIPGSAAIVTGAAGGLGKAFSEELLKRGGRVCLTDINELEGRKVEDTFKKRYGNDTSMFVKCDISAETDVKNMWKAALEKFKQIDLVVNNAGIMNDTMVDKTVEINLMGTIRLSMLAIDHMRKDQGGAGGTIVNIASSAGLFPVFFMPVYTASKYGVVGFTRSWAANPSQKKYGVNFACMCPSFTETPMFNPDVGRLGVITYDDNKDEITDIIDKLGVNSVSDVSQAFVELIEKEDNNGAVVTIDQRQGAVYRYTKHPHRL